MDLWRGVGLKGVLRQVVADNLLCGCGSRPPGTPSRPRDAPEGVARDLGGRGFDFAVVVVAALRGKSHR